MIDRSTVRTARRAAGSVTALAAALVLTACASAAPGMPGGAAPTNGPGFPVALDRAASGEIWGLGGSTAVEIDPSGRVERRIEFGFLPSPWTITALAAGTDDRLFLSAVWSDGEAFGDIVAFDAATGEHTVVAHQESPVGDLAVVGDDVVFVSFAADDERSFTVRRASPTGEIADLAELAGDGSRATIAADATGTIAVTTADGVARLSPSGGTLTEWALPSESTGIAISPTGRVVVTADGDPGCERWLTVGDTGSSRIDGPCLPRGFVWLDEDTVLVSIGDENSADLVHVPVQSSPNGR